MLEGQKEDCEVNWIAQSTNCFGLLVCQPLKPAFPSTKNMENATDLPGLAQRKPQITLNMTIFFVYAYLWSYSSFWLILMCVFAVNLRTRVLLSRYFCLTAASLNHSQLWCLQPASPLSFPNFDFMSPVEESMHWGYFCLITWIVISFFVFGCHTNIAQCG